MYELNTSTYFVIVDKFCYKGVKYNKKDVYIIINGIKYEICDISKNKNETELILQSLDGDILNLCDTHQLIEEQIDDVIYKNPVVNTNEIIYDNPDSMTRSNGVLWYVIVMFGGLIFKEWYLIWIIASIVFWPWFIHKPKFKD